MGQDIYRLLQQHLDHMPVPFPETTSGVEIRLLKHLFNEGEANVALKLSALPEPLEKIHKRFKNGEIDRKELRETLDRLFKKGAIMAVARPGQDSLYSKLPLVIGIFEHQVDRVTKELAEDFFAYEEEGFAKAVFRKKTKQMRTIPVNIQIDPEFHVGSYDNARSIIEQSPGPFAVMNCVCRQAREKMGQSCTQTDIMETCFTLGKSADFMMGKGVARGLDREEILKLLSRAEHEGMVLQPANTQEPGFICCCCGCCCGVLTAAKKYPEPADLFQTNFYASIDSDKCTGCEACLNWCQMEALSFNYSRMEVVRTHCIGCGVCLNGCDFDAISLVKKEQVTIPPKDSREMYKRMIRERYGLFGSLKFMGKAILGKQI